MARTVADLGGHAAVAAKQAYETREMKTLFRQTGTPKPGIQAIAAHTEAIVAETEKEHDTLAAAVSAAVVPVTHVIKITAL